MGVAGDGRSPGLLGEISAGQFDRVVIANMAGTPQQQLDFTKIGPNFQTALHANELFLVVANPDVFLGDPGAATAEASVRYRLDTQGLSLARARGVPRRVIDAITPMVNPPSGPIVFATEKDFTDAVASAAGTSLAALLELAGFLKAVIAGWTFQLSPRSWRNVASGAPTMMIFKFCRSPLEDLVADTSKWNWPSAGALPRGNVTDTQKVIGDIFSTAKARGEEPKAWPDDLYSTFYREIVHNPSWNGVLFLNVPVSLADLPSELQFMTDGIVPQNFFAHHVDFPVNRVQAGGTASNLQQAAAFGLIDYHDPADPGLPETVPSACKVQTLTAYFANATLTGFAARVELMVNRRFVLTGTFQLQAGRPAYAFGTES